MRDVNMSGPETIVLSFHDSLLRKADVALLDGSQWLNDAIIGFAFEYFEKTVFKDHLASVAFVGPGTVQLTKFMKGSDLVSCLSELQLQTKTYIFLPVNDNESAELGGAHWSLLMFDRDARMFRHFDSSVGYNEDAARQVACSLEPCLQVEQRCSFKAEDSPQQTNGYDCGVYVILMAEFLARSRATSGHITMETAVTATTVKQKRTKLKALIHELANS